MRLPFFITKENKYPVGLMLFAFSAAMYLSCNHFHFTTPHELPFWDVDRAVPFMPNTVWIYISEYVFFVVIVASIRDLDNLNKYFYSFLTLQVVSCFIFWIYPTIYPRYQFPLPEHLNPITHYAFSSLRQTDTPANCCPSLHVSSVYLSAFLFIDEKRGRLPFFLIWGTAIALSTLTTKQHYLVDVITGLGASLLMYVIFHRLVRYKPLALQANR